ncbi:hypothetical protein OJ252_3006 [Cryptosporidium canis]|uniref:Uncharacterized protein n=1 Tax=Cryptosporidium canis TaxID=195482 RepID=A0ABQ8P3K7_9CRYT|nr:hypothetical protein OJ252_3006 [Cryptosporidium canis]
MRLLQLFLKLYAIYFPITFFSRIVLKNDVCRSLLELDDHLGHSLVLPQSLLSLSLKSNIPNGRSGSRQGQGQPGYGSRLETRSSPGFGSRQGQGQPRYGSRLETRSSPGFGSRQGQGQGQPRYGSRLETRSSPGFGSRQGQGQPRRRVPSSSGPNRASLSKVDFDGALQDLYKIDVEDAGEQQVSLSCVDLEELSDVLMYLYTMFVGEAGRLDDLAFLQTCLGQLMDIKQSRDLSRYSRNYGISLLLTSIDKVSGAIKSKLSIQSKFESLSLRTLFMQELLSRLIEECNSGDSGSLDLNNNKYLDLLDLTKDLEDGAEKVGSFMKYMLKVRKDYCDETLVENLKYLISNMKRHVSIKSKPYVIKEKRSVPRTKRRVPPASTGTKRTVPIGTKSYMSSTLSSSAKSRSKFKVNQ